MAVEGGGGTLSELYSSAKRLLLKTRDSLERLERLEYSSSSSSSSMAVVPGGSPDDQATAIRRDINQIQSLCSDMDRHWRSIAAKSQRDLWKRKVEQVSEESESLRASLDKYLSRHQKRIQEAQERVELLGRAVSNLSKTWKQMFFIYFLLNHLILSMTFPLLFQNGDSHVMRIFDDEAQATESVHRSSRALEDTFATGVAILSKYSEQREHLKRAQRKALDVLNTLGLSNSLLRLIERRNRVDKWIKYTGMIFTVVIIIVFWRWTR